MNSETIKKIADFTLDKRFVISLFIALALITDIKQYKGIIFLFLFAFLLTSLSPSDLFPKFIRNNYIRPYSLKALPCVLIWFSIIYQMLTIDFKNYKLSKIE